MMRGLLLIGALVLAASPARADRIEPDPTLEPPPQPEPPPEPGPPPGPQGVTIDAPACATTEQVTRAHARYAGEARSADRWNLGWTIAYGVFAGAQVGLALAEYVPGREFDHAAEVSMYTGAGKAVIGMLARVIVPVRLPRVPLTGDACVDAAALERAQAVAGRKEKVAFWLQLGGGLALHAAVGSYLVVKEDSWRDAITSFAMGVVVSGVTLYTLPKHSWRHRRPVMAELSVVPMLTPSTSGLAVVGTF